LAWRWLAMALTTAASGGENVGVRTGRALVLTAVLAVQPFCGVAASYASHRDPVGERVYEAGQLERMIPIAIVAGGFSLAWLLYKARSKAKRLAPDNPERRGC
jgi:hypothetical protein